MTKTLTEQWREGKLPDGWYYVHLTTPSGIDITPILEMPMGEKYFRDFDERGYEIEVLAPVPTYRGLYGENDGNMPTGVFTILKIIKRDIDNAQKRRSLTDLECGIKSQVVSLLKKWGVK